MKEIILLLHDVTENINKKTLYLILKSNQIFIIQLDQQLKSPFQLQLDVNILNKIVAECNDVLNECFVFKLIG